MEKKQRVKTSKEFKEGIKEMTKVPKKNPNKARTNTGGAQPGAGRKKRPNYLKTELRKLIIEELGPERLYKLFYKMYDMAMDGDGDMMKYMINQLYGKPTESIKLSGVMENNINVSVNNAKETLQAKIIKIQEAKEVKMLDDKH
jgi:hypothetical protein